MTEVFQNIKNYIRKEEKTTGVFFSRQGFSLIIYFVLLFKIDQKMTKLNHEQEKSEDKVKIYLVKIKSIRI